MFAACIAALSHSTEFSSSTLYECTAKTQGQCMYPSGSTPTFPPCTWLWGASPGRCVADCNLLNVSDCTRLQQQGYKGCQVLDGMCTTNCSHFDSNLECQITQNGCIYDFQTGTCSLYCPGYGKRKTNPPSLGACPTSVCTPYANGTYCGSKCSPQKTSMSCNSGGPGGYTCAWNQTGELCRHTAHKNKRSENCTISCDELSYMEGWCKAVDTCKWNSASKRCVPNCSSSLALFGAQNNNWRIVVLLL